jgi:2-methylcitrate dehydratase
MENTQTAEIARFAVRARYEDISPAIIDQLKKHLLDSLGSALHAVPRPTIQKLLRQIGSLDTGGNCPVPGLGKTSVDRAAQVYTALIRYPDFMDNFLGKEATCHPSDNIGALLALAPSCQASSKELLTAMAIGYAIECRLVEEIPVMMKGFDHTVLLAYSLTAAVCRLLRLNEEETAHALAIAGCSLNPLVTCRASYTYEWKGLASSFVAQACVNFALMAKEGMTGPLSLFEGPKGFNDVYGMELKYDWTKEDFSLIRKCALKGYNSEVHTQSSLEALGELKREHAIDPEDIKEIDITTFLTCLHIVGGGAYGDRKEVHSKEQADHSLPYVAAVLLLDGQVYPEQLLEERIMRPDVQDLLKKVNVHTGFPIHKPMVLAGLLDPYTEAYPEKLSSKVTIEFRDGKKISLEKTDYHGYYTRPFDWAVVEEKFRRLSGTVIGRETQDRLVGICKNLENGPAVQELLKNLNEANGGETLSER